MHQTKDVRVSPLTFSTDTTLNIQVPSEQVTVQVLSQSGAAAPNVTINATGGSSSATFDLGSSLGPLTVTSVSAFYRYGPVQTDSSGTATVWVYPNIPFTFNANPALSSPFATVDRTLPINVSTYQCIQRDTGRVSMLFNHRCLPSPERG
jgi:hypothetical protein